MTVLNHHDKILSLEKISDISEILKKEGKKTAFTNGCFDIIHSGHINLFKRAKESADKVIVGLNSDKSVSAIKGNSRPVVKEDERAEVISGIQYVDYVVIFDDLTPINLIKKLKPDFLIKGSDWDKKDIVGTEEVLSYGGQVINDVFIGGKSTTEIIKRIKDLSE